jgi:hypothetical protein
MAITNPKKALMFLYFPKTKSLIHQNSSTKKKTTLGNIIIA